MSCRSEKKRKEKMSSFFCLNFFAVSFLLSSVFLFFSCDNFNEPVREFFDYYTNNAAIESVSVPKAIGTYNGMPVIDSSDNVEVYFTLRNPKNYKLNFIHDDIGESVLPEHNSPSQDSLNLSSAKQSFTKSELVEAEKNNGPRIINQTIHLITNDEAERELEPSYNFSIFLNSYPLPVKNPLLQTNQEGAGKYILCFFAPITDGTVHADINKIWINSTSFDFKTDGTVDDTTSFSSTAPSLYHLSNGVKFSDFEVPSGYKACYYNTGIQFSQIDNEIRFNITLEDKYGFKTTSSISNKAKKISKPKIVELENNDIQSGESYIADEDTKLYTIKIFHDGTYDDGEQFIGTAKIYYKIEENSGKNPFGGTSTLTGSANGSVTLNLERGKYNISANAVKNYCVDSDVNMVTEVSIKELPVYYVAPDGTDGAEGDNGSISKPFKRFAYINLYDNYIDKTGDVCTIYLKNNVSNYSFSDGEMNMVAINSGEGCAKYEISGYGGTKTINLSKYENKAVLSVQFGTDVTFKDINITGGKMASGGGNYSLIKNLGILTLENCSITNNNCIGVVSDSEITIKDCAVTGNKNGGVEAKGTINLSGKVVISGNTAKDETDPSKTVNCNLSLHASAYDAEDDKISSVEGLLPSSKIWITKQTPPGTGSPKALVDSWPQVLGNPWDIFTSDSSDFFVDYPSDNEKTKVVLKKQGATVTVGGQNSISFEKVTDSGGANYCAYNVEKEISITSYVLYCYSDIVPSNNYTVTLENGNKKVKITTGSLQPGNYILTLNFEYNGNSYEVNLPFTK